MAMIRLTAVLGFVAALAAGALALTFSATKEKISDQEKLAKVTALNKVFFLLSTTEFNKPVKDAPGVTAIYESKQAMDAGELPLYYAVEGEGTGYNASVPIRLLVGFTHPRRDAAKLLEGYIPENADWAPKDGAQGLYVVGWRVIKSEETPGLGEKAKEEKPAYTLAEKITGTASDPGPDRRTDFQAQFAGRQADAKSLSLSKEGGSIDVITAATYSTVGIVDAVLNAAEKLKDIQSDTAGTENTAE